MTDTLLVLSGIGVPRFAARGLREVLKPLELGELRRDVNGVLRDLTEPDLDHRLSLGLSGGDIRPMPSNGLWRGQVVTVDCTSERGSQATFTAGVGTITCDREPVSGSGFAQLDEHFTATVVFSESSAGVWTAQANFGVSSYAGPGFIYYRPRLVCMVTGSSGEFAEWEAAPTWSLDMEEIGS